MADLELLFNDMYRAFNERDVDGALALMSDDVSWPKASEGGRVYGRGEISAYWERQWKEFDPRVEPVAITEGDEGRVHVRVHQVVRSLAGELLSDSEVVHVYTVRDGLIERMDVDEGESGSDGGPSKAFARR